MSIFYPLQVVIEAIYGTFAKPVIAIDDIVVTENATCPHPGKIAKVSCYFPVH